MKKLVEHTYGFHVFMELELDGVVEKVDWYAGSDCKWETFVTTSDNDLIRRKKVIEAFKELY